MTRGQQTDGLQDKSNMWAALDTCMGRHCGRLQAARRTAHPECPDDCRKTCCGDGDCASIACDCLVLQELEHGLQCRQYRRGFMSCGMTQVLSTALLSCLPASLAALWMAASVKQWLLGAQGSWSFTTKSDDASTT